jgi:hypothetical protein
VSDDANVTIERASPQPAGRGRWGRLAERLGLVRLAVRRRLAGSGTLLVGDRGGYLVALAPSHTLNTSHVDILVRYPLGHTIRDLGADLAAELKRRHRKNLTVGDGAVLLRLPYAVVPPRERTVERALDDLVAAMTDRVRTLDRTCEICLQAGPIGMYVVDGVPGLYCEPCMERFVRGEAELAEAIGRVAPDLERGFWTGLLAALAFGIALGGPAGAVLVKGGRLGPYLVLPLLFVAGYLTSAFASRGFGGSSIVSFLLKLPAIAVAVLVASTVMTAVSRMALSPAEWNLTFLFWSMWGPLRSAPLWALAHLGAAAGGWLVESIVWAISRRRPRVRRARVVRVERESA